jgi:hypothetical protein
MTITDDGAIGISMTMSGLEVVAFTSTYERDTILWSGLIP